MPGFTAKTVRELEELHLGGQGLTRLYSPIKTRTKSSELEFIPFRPLSRLCAPPSTALVMSRHSSLFVHLPHRNRLPSGV